MGNKEALSDVNTIVKEVVLDQFNIIAEKYFKDQLKSFLVSEKIDFNDKIILATCQKNDLVLFTDGKDFKDSDIDILTQNTYYFPS